MIKPGFSVAVNKLSNSLEASELEAIGRSSIEMLELQARMLDDDQDGRKKAVLQRMARGKGPRVNSLHAGDRDISAIDETARRLAVEETLQGISLAHELGAALIVIHPSDEPVKPQDRSRRLVQASRSLAEVADAARRSDIKLAVEMLPRTCLCNTAEELEQLVGPLPQDVFGVCIDTNHLMSRYRSLCDTLIRFKDRLLEVHCSDYDGVDEKHALPGTGVVNWIDVMHTLRHIGFAGPLNYEVVFRTSPPLAERIRTLEENYNWLSNLTK